MRPEFIIERQGKQFVLFAGLLNEAHERGLKGIETELLDYRLPKSKKVDEESFAVVKATVTMEDGRTFQGIGDATGASVGGMIYVHLLRMAETRAKARALRDAINVGMTSLEELGGEDEPQSPPNARSGGRGSSTPNGMSNGRQNGAQRRQGRSQPPAEAAAQRGAARDAPAASPDKARKSQVDLLRTLAEELRGENGVKRLEERIGKPLTELTKQEANEWIDRLAPQEDS